MLPLLLATVIASQPISSPLLQAANCRAALPYAAVGPQTQPRAKKIHRELKSLGLPTIDDVRDQFEKKAKDLGVNA